MKSCAQSLDGKIGLVYNIRCGILCNRARKNLNPITHLETLMQMQKIKGQKVYMIAALAVAVVGVLLYAIVNVGAIKEFIGRVWVIFAPVV